MAEMMKEARWCNPLQSPSTDEKQNKRSLTRCKTSVGENQLTHKTKKGETQAIPLIKKKLAKC